MFSGLIGFASGAQVCPIVTTYPVKGLYYGHFPVYVEAGSAWDVECVLNTWERHNLRGAWGSDSSRHALSEMRWQGVVGQPLSFL